MYKVYRVVLGIGIFLSASAPASAAIVNFELDFFADSVFDENNARVGSGTFSYDNNSSLTCSEIRRDFTCYTEDELNNLSPDEEEDLIVYGTQIINNPLTDFEANIYGVNWNDSYGKWWSDEASEQAPGYISPFRGGTLGNFNSWFFGDFFDGSEELFLRFESYSDAFGTGTWSQYTGFTPPPNAPTQEPGVIFSGTWEATIVGATPEPNPAPSNPTPTPEPNNPASVPEPSNVFGGLVAIILGYYTWRGSIKVRPTKA